jgi:cyclic beta-1,2-glucan synthetase
MEKLSGLKSGKNQSAFVHSEEDAPIRAELFSVERLEQFAETLAAEHQEVAQPKRFRQLLPRLEDNGRILVNAYRILADAVRNESTISPAAEWLIDNFHIIEEQLREIQEDLPKGYYRELPKLTQGDFAGYPRIYAVGITLIAHTDSRLEVETLERFLRAYQTITPLSIGELWAVAISLRLALVENLRRLASRIITSRQEREEADELTDELIELAARQPDELLPFMVKRLGKRKKFGQAFIAQVTRQLREQDPSIAPAFEWLENQLRKQGESTEQIMQAEYQRQAAMQVTVSNIITSMRLLSTLDWRDFFESVSLIDPLLNSDPAQVYAEMNFLTRNRYRGVVERIAKRTNHDELDVAKRVIEFARQAQQTNPSDPRYSHVGYYLIDDGLGELEKEFRYRPPFRKYFSRILLQHPTTIYLGMLTCLTVLILVLLVYAASYFGLGIPWLIVFAMLSLILASDLALSVLNWDFTRLIAPRLLPQLDTDAALPEDAQTMVVIPTMLTSQAVIEELLEKLEVYYLANQDEKIYFALIGDFADAPREEMPHDSAILDAALGRIKELNEKHNKNGTQKFHLFHRRRLYNDGEEIWMGWERKRGKLQEFNRLLRGAKDTTFMIATADEKLLSRIRYVITLDSDTQLPRDAARKLIGIAAHPLNRPHFDVELQRVTKGYGILQPRVSISLTSAARSRFTRIFSGTTGFDPYTTATSDLYQDLFGEGSFTGKGLYDVDAFEAALKGRVPENSILSHDLFEGLYARCGLVTDIELLDDFPTYYDSFAIRSHRWVRGDWQIARWIFPWVKDAEGRTVRNHLPLISRWKILDNLRRSLVAPTVFLWLLMVWTVIPGSPFLWTLFIILELAFPVYAHLNTNLLTHPRGVAWGSHLLSLWGDFRNNALQVAFSITCLANQAWIKTDAIMRTLYRKLISRKHLLEWTTAAQSERENPHDQPAFLRFMWIAMGLSVASFGLIIWLRPNALPFAAPFLLAWFFSPFVAFQVSRPVISRRLPLSGNDLKMARKIARRTWRFFETFVGDEDNWLPPDNFQENPQPKIAHRTSPTNIGLLLLSTVTARDFCYIGTLELIERLGLTFATLEKLERFRGQFLNWYDTQTLEALAPRYISTVDSGNLAGHLLAVKQAIQEFPDRKLYDQRLLAGLADTVEMMREEALQVSAFRQRTGAVTIKQLRDEVEACGQLLSIEPPTTPDAWLAMLEALLEHLEVITDIAGALAQEHGDSHFDELRYWTTRLSHQTYSFRRDIETFFPLKETDFSQLAAMVKRDFPDREQEWQELTELLPLFPSLSQLPEWYDTMLLRLLSINEEIKRSQTAERDSTALLNALQILTAKVKKAAQSAARTLTDLSSLTLRSEQIVEEMEFTFLLDEERQVFSIGYSVDTQKRDKSFYDLLASEARLTSFVAIAKGEISQEHWFRLGRSLTPVKRSRALISWTATMFEYLMPVLVMRDYDETLLHQTYQAIVARQIDYGAKHKVPWGISESAYNARDLQLNYQYGAFGVPGLGLKRGLSQDLVVAPYATALASQISPRSAIENFYLLAKQGALARFGFYEAIDYTPERLPPNQERAIIQAFMAHHQGMILVALNNLVHDNIMQRRFHAEPLVQATELLLQERIPRGIPASHPRAEEVLSSRVVRQLSGRVTRIFDTPHLPTPRTQILSNGAYSVMVTNSGAGYSMCDGLAVTRWREDVTCDDWGGFIYLRDIVSGMVWSSGFQPVGREPKLYEVAFSEDKAVFLRRDGNIATRTEIIVSPEDNAEIRLVSITNHSSRVRDIEVTSYAEVVLASPNADAAHPAFSNLFIETEFNAAENALIAKRRPRTKKDNPIWAVHTIATDGETLGAVQYETDRARFLGRGHDASAPLAVMEDRLLSNTVGAVLDPIFSLRRCLRIQPHETVAISFSTAVAQSYPEALRLADKYHDVSTFEREAALAWTRSQVEMRYLNIDPENAYLFQRLAARILYSDSSLRPRPQVLALNSKAQSDLWAYGISGDLPIVLVRINRSEDLAQVRQLLNAHEYLRLKGLVFDLVILNDHPPSYIQALQDEIVLLVRTSGESQLMDKNGGIFLKRADQMSEADRILLHTVARAVIVTERGDFEDQLVRRPTETDLPNDFIARNSARSYPGLMTASPDLTFFNGLGGFDQSGKEYVTILGEGQWTPAPWLNVIANDKAFGFQVSETGAGFTWGGNSRENRLTPWSNDMVSDPPGEVIYLRDEESGLTWTPTPLPIREAEPYTIKHGQGYTIFEHLSHGIAQNLLMFVPLDAPVKISLLRLHNRTNRKRRLSITSYNELVLGNNREHSAPFILTEIDPVKRSILARNPYNNEFAGRTAFVATSAEIYSLTCDRKEFLGRNGHLKRPAAMRREKLSGRSGAALDPCAALQTLIELEPDESREIAFLIGEGESKEEALQVISRFRQLPVVLEALERVLRYWDELLGAVEVRTPDAALNTIVNRWLLYQSLACRIWARSAFYQSGGAYGFRDQLQDVMSLVYTKPEMVREQILRAASRQFKEGDVQHWWHPPTGRGVRTRFSDDLLWLPFVTSFYINVTGDQSVLDETVPFIEAPLLVEGEDESYTQPTISLETANIFEHCARTLDRSLAVGEHGLPLMGSGDWNDGMSSVGNEGKGESVWVGWFLLNTLQDFAPFCRARKEEIREKKYFQHIEDLKIALNKNAWDGDWFRRAYFDDGTPLGSAVNEECRIDSIAQSWSVISGGANPQQAARAMASVDEYLIRRGDGIILLFTPPFDRSSLEPGYIKGYVPGVRENGGQYTHAALWTLIAFAILGDGDRVGELFALLNPISHASTRAGLHKYKVEPYVAAGDVYAESTHVGRGGWTWYTGSAGWMYRAALESMLGFHLQGEFLRLDPCIPRSWREFEIIYRKDETTYKIKVENPSGVSRGVVETRLNDNVLADNQIPLAADGQTHQVLIRLGN